MSEFRVSSRYANALLELAEEKNLFEQISGDVEFIFNTLSGSKELKKILASPVIKESKKIDILKALFEDRVSKETLNFLLFVVKKNRIDMVSDIFGRYIDLHNIKTGIVEAFVLSAFIMDDAQKNFVKSKLESITGKKVKMKFEVDENLIGGFKVKIGDEVYDASVFNQLKILKSKFIKESFTLN